MKTVFIALGTNLGDRVENLRAAIDSLSSVLSVLRESTIYETPPWGFTDQPAFLNMVIEVETNLEPLVLLAYLKKQEDELGRVESFRYGPRQIDLDILFYDDFILEDDKLQIPHPRLHERAFVLVPQAELAPDLVHPILKKSINILLKDVDTSEITPFSV